MADEARTGRDRLVSNVISGWVAQAVAIVVGFLMPRLIDESVGQAALGLWDLGWSLVVILTLSGFGLGSATTYYVSLYRASRRPRDREIRESVATVFYLQLLLLLTVAAAGVVGLVTLPGWIAESLRDDLADIQWLGALLGPAIVLALLGDVGRGVLAGVHRADVNDLTSIAADVTLAIAMIVVLFGGLGIRGLAAATLLVKLVEMVVRIRLAYRYCPELGLRIADVRWNRVGRALTFGFKSSTAALPALLVNQAGRILLATTAGPAALAVFSRPVTLVGQILRIVERFTYILPPVASSMQGAGRGHDLRRLNLRASKAAVLMSMPPIVVFGVFGNDIVHVWMGPEFVYPGIPWVLALMALAGADRGVAARILSGVNAHGRISLACLVLSVATFAIAYLLLRPLDPFRCAVLVATASILGIFLPQWVLSCRRFEIGLAEYARYVYARPLLANLAFLPGLIAARQALDAADYVTAVLWAAGSLLLLALLYHWFAIDREFYVFLRRRLQPRPG